ncbi:hypothetical protein WMY93_006490 [Mugilogobius chulae]|uniref:C2H2-type domain-containing protein n=1 Tax=Mugilogobius chulae TaxID=88201 RepID=A0AAW0PK32_9GOBI
MASSKDRTMNQLRSFVHQRLNSSAQEILEEVETILTLKRETQRLQPSQTSATQQVCITSTNEIQPLAPAETLEARISPHEEFALGDDGNSAMDTISEQTGQEAETVTQPEVESVSRARARRHSCNICEKSFTSMSKLKTHERTHTRPHHCDICKRTFSRPISLSRHMFRHNKPYHCDVCGKAFVQKHHLERHTSQCVPDDEASDEDATLSSDLNAETTRNAGFSCGFAENGFSGRKA